MDDFSVSVNKADESRVLVLFGLNFSIKRYDNQKFGKSDNAGVDKEELHPKQN